jgi:hypothetical protein
MSNVRPQVQAVTLLVQVALVLVAGWWLLLLPMGIASLFGLHGWGFFHSGLVLLCLPFTLALAFWLVRLLPWFKPLGVQNTEPRSPDSLHD